MRSLMVEQVLPGWAQRVDARWSTVGTRRLEECSTCSLTIDPAIKAGARRTLGSLGSPIRSKYEAGANSCSLSRSIAILIKFFAFVKNLSRYAVWIVGALFLLSVAFICTEIAMRRILGFFTPRSSRILGLYTRHLHILGASLGSLQEGPYSDRTHSCAGACLASGHSQHSRTPPVLLCHCFGGLFRMGCGQHLMGATVARQHGRSALRSGYRNQSGFSAWWWFAICLALITLGRSFIAILQGDRATVGELADSLSLDQGDRRDAGGARRSRAVRRHSAPLNGKQ